LHSPSPRLLRVRHQIPMVGDLDDLIVCTIVLHV
jgi:hypothetical protein